MQQEEQKIGVWETLQGLQSTGSLMASALLIDEIKMERKEKWKEK